MLRLNESVVTRSEGDMILLFYPCTGTMTRINRTGLMIWNLLKKGLDEKEITASFVKAFPGENPDNLAESVHNFLAMLAGQRYITGFEGEAAAPMYSEPPEMNNYPLYEMNSMRRVFTPGDALVPCDIPFADYRPGDIVIFYPNGRNTTGIVHRVISRTDGELTTMGDNNPVPDARKVTAGDFPALVTARIRPDGRRFEVKRGRPGMRQFRINRIRRFGHVAVAAMIRPLLPLMFWRRELKQGAEFDGIIQYYHNRVMIAKKTSCGVEFRPAWKKLLYKLPEKKVETEK